MMDMRPLSIFSLYWLTEKVFTYMFSPKYVMPPEPIAGYSS